MKKKGHNPDVMDRKELKKSGGVYFLKHKTKQIVKFGSTKNVYNRMGAHQCSFKDTMYIDKVIYINEYIKLEDILKKGYANDTHVDEVGHTHGEIIRYTSDDELKDLYDNIDNIANMVNENTTEEMNTHIEILNLEIEKLKLISKNEKERLKQEMDRFYKFLIENSFYDEGNVMTSIEIKESYEKIMKEKINKLNYNTFIHVDNRYKISQNKKMCKHCKKMATRSCCENYNNKDRIRYSIIKNIRIKDNKDSNWESYLNYFGLKEITENNTTRVVNNI